MTTYAIVRFFRDNHPQQIIKEGLTLDEAREHCNDDESSSETCCDIEGMILLSEKGPWFDGFREE